MIIHHRGGGGRTLTWKESFAVVFAIIAAAFVVASLVAFLLSPPSTGIPPLVAMPEKAPETTPTHILLKEGAAVLPPGWIKPTLPQTKDLPVGARRPTCGFAFHEDGTVWLLGNDDGGFHSCGVFLCHEQDGFVLEIPNSIKNMFGPSSPRPDVEIPVVRLEFK